MVCTLNSRVQNMMIDISWQRLCVQTSSPFDYDPHQSVTGRFNQSGLNFDRFCPPSRKPENHQIRAGSWSISGKKSRKSMNFHHFHDAPIQIRIRYESDTNQIRIRYESYLISDPLCKNCKMRIRI